MQPPHPHDLRVNDFAFRKGQRYDTVIINLEQQRPIAMPNDRKATTLTDGSKDYLKIQLVPRVGVAAQNGHRPQSALTGCIWVR